ncbi:hypothetical protein BN77_0809 [Rhizobium mesoamericanum STM3625]|uniref:Uncharacterized protein n=1 Tax=Rhizobium mesoamericanum STM3625 TaxID=1211777 RepID=K0PMW8_9HYPH|nr:hypothetical protein BN77_0809 [Rhizobium mesoamericanum STM3625]
MRLKHLSPAICVTWIRVIRMPGLPGVAIVVPVLLQHSWSASQAHSIPHPNVDFFGLLRPRAHFDQRSATLDHFQEFSECWSFISSRATA